MRQQVMRGGEQGGVGFQKGPGDFVGVAASGAAATRCVIADISPAPLRAREGSWRRARPAAAPPPIARSRRREDRGEPPSIDEPACSISAPASSKALISATSSLLTAQCSGTSRCHIPTAGASRSTPATTSACTIAAAFRIGPGPIGEKMQRRAPPPENY